MIEKENMINNYDVVLVCSKDHVHILQKNIAYLKKNLSPKNIVVISSVDSRDLIDGFESDSVIFLNEDRIYPGMTIQRIKEIVKEITGSEKRAGWYFQQFLKMAYSQICNDTEYLIWDADTIPLNSISFKEGDKLKFTMESRYGKDYFITLKKLLGYSKATNESFIAEHMIINTYIMCHLIAEIEDQNLRGKTFYEKILYSVQKESVPKSGFSEFETYGTFVLKNYPEKYVLSNVRSLRNGKMYLGENPGENLMQWVARNYDTVSFEIWDKTLPLIPTILSNKNIQKFWIAEKVFCTFSSLPKLGMKLKAQLLYTFSKF